MNRAATVTSAPVKFRSRPISYYEHTQSAVARAHRFQKKGKKNRGDSRTHQELRVAEGLLGDSSRCCRSPFAAQSLNSSTCVPVLNYNQGLVTEARFVRKGNRRLLTALILLWACTPGSAANLAEGFVATEIFTGLLNPVAARFAQNGQVFVALKDGRVLAYDHIYAPDAKLVVDLRVQVHNFWDRGLLGLAIHPEYPAVPDIFVAYTHDAYADGTGPRWGNTDPELSVDPCPTPPGALEGGCVVYGRLSRVRVEIESMTGVEEPILDGNWCQQYPSHSLGDLVFDEKGYLYLSAGDGASFSFPDTGQGGSPTGDGGVPVNPCDDPPDGVGGPNDGPDAEGGALRSQDILTPDDHTSFDGAILRLDVSGRDLGYPPDNPLAHNLIEDDDPIVAMGLRNPYRLAVRPGTSELWIAEPGLGTWEEINRLGEDFESVKNFGWPCYEGGNNENIVQSDFQQLDLCKRLYTGDLPAPMTIEPPYFAYRHGQPVTAKDQCEVDRSAISAIAFYDGQSYPKRYADGLTFGDSRRRCLWFMPASPDGLPDPSQLEPFLWGASGWIVDLQMGTDGNLYFVDYRGTPHGKVWRVDYRASNDKPNVFLTLSYENQFIVVDEPLTLAGSAGDTEDGDLSHSIHWVSDRDGPLGSGPAISVTLSEGNHEITASVSDSNGASGSTVTPLLVQPDLVLTDSFELAPTPSD